MNWIPMSKQMPPDADEEIFIRKLDCTEWQQTPANEIWLDIYCLCLRVGMGLLENY